MSIRIVKRKHKCRRCGGDRWKRCGKVSYVCVVCKRASARKWREKDNGAAKLWSTAKERAHLRGLTFSITVDDVIAAMPPDGKCPALGITMKKHHSKGGNEASPTLDRLLPEWGYVPNNIAVISNAANRIKSNARASELEQVAAWMKQRGLD